MKKKNLTACCTCAFVLASLSACVTPENYYDAGLGEADYYGTVPTLPGYTPEVWNPNPLIAIGAGLGLAPIYLNVPAYQRLNWGVYCSIYNACYRPVYFVLNSWYRRTFAPAYLRIHGGPGPAFRPMGQPGGMRPRPPANGPRPGAKPSPGSRPNSSGVATATVKPGSIPGLRPSVQRPGAFINRPRPSSGVATASTRPANRPSGANRPAGGAKPASGAKPAGGAKPASAPRPPAPRPAPGTATRSR